jgi:hypothetical protein
MSSQDAGTVLVQRLINFMNFHHEIGKRAIEQKIPAASDEFPAEKRAELIEALTDMAIKAHDSGIEMVKSIPASLVFQLVQTNMMNSLDRCEEIMNAGLDTRELLLRHIQLIAAEEQASQSPQPSLILSALVTVNECGTDEELHKLRRYLQCFVETTVGSDLAAARKRFDSNREYYLKQRETAKALLLDNVRGEHIGPDGVGLHEGGPGEGAGGDGEGRAEEECGKGKEKEGEAVEGEPSAGHDLSTDHSGSEGAGGERVSSSGCSSSGATEEGSC